MKRVIPYPYTSSQSKHQHQRYDTFFLQTSQLLWSVTLKLSMLVQEANYNTVLNTKPAAGSTNKNSQYLCNSLGFHHCRHTVQLYEPYQAPHNTYFTGTYAPHAKRGMTKQRYSWVLHREWRRRCSKTESRTVRFIFSSGTGKSFSPVPYSSLHSPTPPVTYTAKYTTPVHSLSDP
jgi:hypothetical protein